MLVKFKWLVISTAVFFLFLTGILYLLPFPFSSSASNEFPPLDSVFSKYAVSFDTAFKKTESKLTDKASADVLVLPRSDILMKQGPLSFYSAAGRNYSQYTSTSTILSTGEVLYNKNYEFENALRRVGKTKPPPKGNLALVFVGCSFTMGEGVDFEESMPGIFEKNYPAIEVYSLAVGGMALNDHLYLLQNGRHFLNHKLADKIILVYVFMKDHIFRESCSTNCIASINSWRLEKPRYEIIDDRLAYVGPHSSKYLNNFFTRLIFNSKMMQDRHVPDLNSSENYTRHRKILEEFLSAVKKNQNVLGAYDFFGLGNSTLMLNQLLPYVQKTAFKPVILNYYAGKFKSGLQPYLIPYDSHPSPLGYQASYEALLFQLKKDYPEFF